MGTSVSPGLAAGNLFGRARIAQVHRGGVRAGAYTRPRFDSTEALSMGQGEHLGIV